MTFIHGYLLGGLLLAGVPILLHLIMRQKPRRLSFPAFRFLKQKQRINQRKLRLQHLLLLALRILVIAALCLALARPRVFSQRFSMGDRPVSAVLLFDTSASMGYLVAGQSRLDEARRRAHELLAEMGEESSVAILDSGDTEKPAFYAKTEAAKRIDGLVIRPSSYPLNGALDDAFRMLEERGASENAPPRLLYVFSDRTRACWKAPQGKLPTGVQAVFVDVGVAAPHDQAIDKIEVVPEVVAPGAPYEVRVSVRATDADHANELSCQVGDVRQPQRPLQLSKDQPTEAIVFEGKAPTPPADSVEDVPYPITVKLAVADALLANNARHATLIVRRPRPLLTIIDDARSASPWRQAVDTKGNFRCTVKRLSEVEKLTPKDLASYKVICLFQVAAPPEALWQKLAGYVRDGGGLTLVPAGTEMGPEALAAYNKHPEILPARWVRLLDTPPGKPAPWAEFRSDNPVTEPLARWARTTDADYARPEGRPFARRYWEIAPIKPGALVFANYADAKERPALVARAVGKGRVLQFTTPLDFRRLSKEGPFWHNYLPPFSSFGFVLIDQACLYLGGQSAAPDWLKFGCGQVPTVPLSAGARGPFSLSGPELTESEKNLESPKEGERLAMPQARAPGNYLVLDNKERPVAGFSLTVPAEENDLERAANEEIDAVLGPNAVLPVERTKSLAEMLAETRPPPVELLPLLMMLLVLVLTAEGLLANKFYRRVAPQPGAEGDVGTQRAVP